MKSSSFCPECGRKMRQQFIGLKHCECGISWLKGTGFFYRTPDMIFCLKRIKIGAKTKHVPFVKYKKYIRVKKRRNFIVTSAFTLNPLGSKLLIQFLAYLCP